MKNIEKNDDNQKTINKTNANMIKINLNDDYFLNENENENENVDDCNDQHSKISSIARQRLTHYQI